MAGLDPAIDVLPLPKTWTRGSSPREGIKRLELQPNRMMI
jgi:hypothetical protein